MFKMHNQYHILHTYEPLFIEMKLNIASDSVYMKPDPHHKRKPEKFGQMQSKQIMSYLTM